MLDYDIQIHETLPSSNNVVKRAIEEGADEGLVVCTYQQTAGYGRLGRSWVSPYGGLYFSLLLRPQVSIREMPAVGLVIALALQQALVEYLPVDKGERLGIKWPNDLVLVEDKLTGVVRKGQFRKISGISMERHAGGTCIGIGVNVLHPFDEKEVGGKNTPIYLADLMGERMSKYDANAYAGAEGLTEGQKRLIMSVCSSFLHAFQGLYDQWVNDGLAPFVDDYAAHMCLQGQYVSMVNQADQRIVSGVVTGVDSAGRLLLEGDDGATLAVNSGEVTLL